MEHLQTMATTNAIRCYSLHMKRIFGIECVRKVAVHLEKLSEVTTTSVYKGLNSFNFIRKHFRHICL
jgi:hypothetical protein